MKRFAEIAVLFALLCIPCVCFAQQKYALLIGISDYPQYKNPEASWTQIHGTNDVQLLLPVLKGQGFKVFTLTNETATHKAIEEGFKRLANRVHEGDLVYIHLSGHGQPDEDVDGDEDDGWDEAFIPYDAERRYQENGYHGENHLLDDELNGYLNNVRRRVGERGIVYVAIDACHAGSSYRGEEDIDSVCVRGTEMGFSKTNRTYVPRINRSGSYKIATEKGMAPICMLEACRAYEVNLEIIQDGKYYGPMSYYIWQQLLTNPMSNDTKWIEKVRESMNKDRRLIRQNMVIEISE